MRISYGIICYNIDQYGHKNYLLVCRLHSIHFELFVRGHYEIEYDKIALLFEQMSIYEQESIVNLPFNRLWCRANNITSIRFTEQYLIGKNMYNAMKTYLREKYSMTLGDIVEKHRSKWAYPEWGFPKGRPQPNESGIDCAKREFFEETNIDKNGYTFPFGDDKTISEGYRSDDDNTYQCFYYVAESKIKHRLFISKQNKHQAHEILALKWCKISECKKLIRDNRKISILSFIERFHSRESQ